VATIQHPIAATVFLLATGGLLIGAEPAADKSAEGKLFHNAPASYWAHQLSGRPHAPAESEAEIRDRWYAVHALGQLGPEAACALAPLEEILADKYEFEYIRGGAAWALGRIGTAARPAAALLIDTLTSKHVSVRRSAPVALAAIGGDEAKEAVPAIARLLDDEDAGVQASAALALWHLDRDPRAVPKLVRMLEKGKDAAPYQAAVALGRLGPEAAGAIGPLVAALRHADEDVRRAAARALGDIGPPSLPAVEAAIQGKDVRTSREAAEALGFSGPAAIPPLTAALRHADPQIRRIAARALGRLGPQAHAARSALVETVSDPDPAVRDTAADALKRVGQATESGQ
jgi:HEAT repeat protein